MEPGLYGAWETVRMMSEGRAEEDEYFATARKRLQAMAREWNAAGRPRPVPRKWESARKRYYQESSRALPGWNGVALHNDSRVSTGVTSFVDWVTVHGTELGRGCVSEVKRNWSGT